MKNIPNQLTVSRVLLIFIFVALSAFDSRNPNCFYAPERVSYIFHVIAVIFALIAGLTDLLDGYLARKMKVESDFGRLLDPLADKILVLATFTMMVAYSMIPGWFLIVILTREFMVTGLRTLASAKGIVIAADRWGKLKTALQMFMLAIGGCSWIHLFGFSIADGTPRILWLCLMSLVAIVTIASGLGYFIKYKKLYLESI